MQLEEKLSLFLAFRRWDLPPKKKTHTYYDNTDGLLCQLYDMAQHLTGKRIGICLSAGIDSGLVSAIFRPLVAYTLVYRGNDGEFVQAQRHLNGAAHIPILVTRSMYLQAAREIIKKSQEPIPPHSPLFYIMAKQAKADGCDVLLTGLGAEGNGEMSHLYANRKRDKFIQSLYRMTIDPKSVLVNAADVDWVFDAYCKDDVMDVQRFLSEIGTGGATSSNEGVIDLAGVRAVSPFKGLRFSGRYKPHLIARGAIKPHLSEAYNRLYDVIPPKKKALAAPYKRWMSGWKPSREEFLPLRGRVSLPGKRLFLVWALENYLNLFGGFNAS